MRITHACHTVQAILFETGMLRRLQPQALHQLRSLSSTFIARAESHDFTVRQCINILSTMTLLGEPDVPLHDAIVCRCVPELPKTDPEDVGSLCYILGINSYSRRTFLQALESLLLQRHAQFSPRALAKAVWMLGRVQYNNEDVAGLVDEVVRRCLSDNAAPTVRLISALPDLHLIAFLQQCLSVDAEPIVRAVAHISLDLLS